MMQWHAVCEIIANKNHEGHSTQVSEPNVNLANERFDHTNDFAVESNRNVRDVQHSDFKGAINIFNAGCYWASSK
jgi:hypothetical protein